MKPLCDNDVQLQTGSLLGEGETLEDIALAGIEGLLSLGVSLVNIGSVVSPCKNKCVITHEMESVIFYKKCDSHFKSHFSKV